MENKYKYKWLVNLYKKTISLITKKLKLKPQDAALFFSTCQKYCIFVIPGAVDMRINRFLIEKS